MTILKNATKILSKPSKNTNYYPISKNCQIAFSSNQFTIKKEPVIYIIIVIVIHYLITNDLENIFLSVVNYLKIKYSTTKVIKILSQKDEEEAKPIHIASYRGVFRIVKRISEYDRDIMARDIRGFTVLHWAAKGNCSTIFVYFIKKYNLNLLSPDFSGNTPLHIACASGSDEVVRFILMELNNIDQQNEKGETALHSSLTSEKTDIVKKLIKKGIDITIKNNDGLTALEVAQKNIYATNLYHLIKGFQRINGKNLDSHEYYNPITFFVLFFLIELSCAFLIWFDLERQGKNMLTFILVNGLSLFLFFVYISTSDPGIVKSDLLTNDWVYLIENGANLNKFCPYCKIMKINSLKHCHECHHCIIDFDHHCNWIGNCVGSKNQKSFIFFLITLIFNLVICFWKGMGIYKNNEGNIYIKIYCILLMTSCLILLVPILYIFYGQLKNRQTDKAKTKS